MFCADLSKMRAKEVRDGKRSEMAHGRNAMISTDCRDSALIAVEYAALTACECSMCQRQLTQESIANVRGCKVAVERSQSPEVWLVVAQSTTAEREKKGKNTTASAKTKN